MNQNIFKKKYDKLRMQLFTYKGHLEANLITDDINNTARNITLNRQQNEVPVLEFDMPFTKERKIDVVTGCEKLVRFLDWYYIIKSTSVSDGSKKEIHVRALGEQEELKYCYCNCVNEIGKTVKECFEAVFSATTHPIDTGYVFLGTDIPDSKKRHLITENEASVYQNLMSICDVFQCWLEFSLTNDGKKGIFFRSKEKDNGKKFKTGIDLKELNIEYDSSEIFTRLIPYGAEDELTGNPLTIIEVNPTHKAYIEDYSYYLGVLGIPPNIVDKEAKYLNIKTWSDDTIIDANYLYEMAKQELAKCCVPTLEATLSISDLSKLLDSSIDECEIGQSVLALNKKLGFRIKFLITGIEENFNNPLDTKITIKNKINIDTNIQNINHTCEIVDGVTSMNTENGNAMIPMNKVEDGDHWNVVQRLDQQYSFAKYTYDNINLKVENIGHSVAQIDIKADEITSSVEEIQDDVTVAKSEIKQTARKISAVVTENGDSGEWELSKDAFMIAFNGSTNNTATIDRHEGLVLGSPDNDSYSKIGYDGRMEFMMDGRSYPYRALVGMVQIEVHCHGSYTEGYSSIPPEFRDIPEDEIITMVSIKKNYNYDDQGYFCTWFGAYPSDRGATTITGESNGIRNGKVYVECMSEWANVDGDTSSGDMIVQVLLIA